MPKTNIDYQNTIIYKIVCNDLDVPFLYVGFTTDFTKRKNRHKTSCNNSNSEAYNFKIYSFIRSNGGWDN
jgi:predicted GIY-YIG superfamily endonuclease